MVDTLITIAALCFGFLVLPLIICVVSIAICVLSDRLRDPPPSPEEMRAAREAYAAQLRNPDFEAVEARLGLPIPAEVRQLYEDERLLAESPFVALSPSGEKWGVRSFLPMNDESLDEGFYIDEVSLPFAVHMKWARYYVRLDQCRDGRCPVYLGCGSGDDGSQVAASLTEFLSYPRRPGWK